MRKKRSFVFTGAEKGCKTQKFGQFEEYLTDTFSGAQNLFFTYKKISAIKF